MRRPLVVLDALLLRPQPTGVGRSILEWTAALARKLRFCDFAVLCTDCRQLEHLADQPGWSLIPCPGAGGGTLRKAAWTQFAMPGLLRRLGADLLHCLQFVAPLRAPCPTVVTVHDLGYLHFPGTIERSRRNYYRWLVPPSLRGAAAVVCNSGATANDVRTCFPGTQDRVHTTPFGVPTWVQERPVAAERDPEAPFLFVGTLEPRKNLEGLLRAYGEFRQLRTDQGRFAPQLILVGGRGWQDSGLRRLLAPLAASGAVVIKDYCGPEELWQQYCLARALLLPSLHEGFGFPILEAMSAGTPVMTSDRGAMAEVAGQAALLVDPLDPTALVAGMQRLTDDQAFCDDLVIRGRANLEHWTWSRTAESVCEVYQQVLSGRPGGSR
jgi:glycosyltransferase involved in cell wall biosynthesis